jgi:fido (protein-threonine AMPylation protein)
MAMENFDEYLRQGEPNKSEKARLWKTAIGLQQVDGLQPSEYLIDAAKQNIEGDITIEEVKRRIDTYYQQHPPKSDQDRTEEADKVSARIAEMLSEQTFSFSPAEYLAIHRRLFTDIYDFAGKMRDYNITKKEWVLNGETVLYASADSLKATLEYDFEQEKKFSYKGLSEQEIVEHIANFISNVWQIHIFGEGNTRATAIFLIKYLRKMGFKKVNNDLFAHHSWYFRNALVRANYEDFSKGIYRSNAFLIRFLTCLMFNAQASLKNREMHILADTVNDTVNPSFDTVNDTVNDSVILLIKEKNTITASEISERLNLSLSSVRRRMKALKDAGKLQRLGSDKKGHWRIIV